MTREDDDRHNVSQPSLLPPSVPSLVSFDRQKMTVPFLLVHMLLCAPPTSSRAAQINRDTCSYKYILYTVCSVVNIEWMQGFRCYRRRRRRRRRAVVSGEMRVRVRHGALSQQIFFSYGYRTTRHVMKGIITHTLGFLFVCVCELFGSTRQS